MLNAALEKGGAGFGPLCAPIIDLAEVGNRF